MTRKEHVEWAKQRALEYVDRGDLAGALASITSDLAKHPETDIPGYHFACMAGLYETNSPERMRKFIEDFN